MHWKYWRILCRDCWGMNFKSRFSTAKYSNTRQIDASVTVVHTWPHYHLIPYKNVHGKSWRIPCRVWWGMNFMNIVYIYIVASKRAVFHCVPMAPYACLIFWLRNDRSITSPGWSQLPFFLEVSSMSIWSQVRLSFFLMASTIFIAAFASFLVSLNR